jgi:hypothetical protein
LLRSAPPSSRGGRLCTKSAPGGLLTLLLPLLLLLLLLSYLCLLLCLLRC